MLEPKRYSKPVVFVAASIGAVRGNHGWTPVWKRIEAMPDDIMIVVDGGGGRPKLDNSCEFDGAKAWIRDYLGPMAEFWPVHRIAPSDVLDEHEVLQELWSRAPVGQMGAFAREIGVDKNLLSQIRSGYGRPGTTILNALGLVRVWHTQLYVRKQSWMLGWSSDPRGGRGGTTNIAA